MDTGNRCSSPKGQEMETNHDDVARDLLLLARLTARRAVAESECWLWLGARDRDGYGMIWLEGRTQSVHRLSAILFLGLDPKSGLYVLHHCDQPSCFNPDHLRPGTQADNMADATL